MSLGMHLTIVDNFTDSMLEEGIAGISGYSVEWSFSWVWLRLF
jgi:hypothetical protein